MDVARAEVQGVALILGTEAGHAVDDDTAGAQGIHLIARLFVVVDAVAYDAETVFLYAVWHDTGDQRFAVADVAGVDACAAAVFVVAEVLAVGVADEVAVAAAQPQEGAFAVAVAAGLGAELQRTGGAAGDVVGDVRVKPRTGVVKLVCMW